MIVGEEFEISFLINPWFERKESRDERRWVWRKMERNDGVGVCV